MQTLRQSDKCFYQYQFWWKNVNFVQKKKKWNFGRNVDHCTVSVTSSFTPPPPIPPTQRHLWHFDNARRADMSNFLLDFPWNDYCFRTRDPDLAATAVGEVVDSGMRAYIPYSLKINFFSNIFPFLSVICQNIEDNLRILTNFGKFSRKNSKIYGFRPYVFKKLQFSFFVFFNKDYSFLH